MRWSALVVTVDTMMTTGCTLMKADRKMLHCMLWVNRAASQTVAILKNITLHFVNIKIQSLGAAPSTLTTCSVVTTRSVKMVGVHSEQRCPHWSPVCKTQSPCSWKWLDDIQLQGERKEPYTELGAVLDLLRSNQFKAPVCHWADAADDIGKIHYYQRQLDSLDAGAAKQLSYISANPDCRLWTAFFVTSTNMSINPAYQYVQ